MFLMNRANLLGKIFTNPKFLSKSLSLQDNLEYVQWIKFSGNKRDIKENCINSQYLLMKFENSKIIKKTYTR